MALEKVIEWSIKQTGFVQLAVMDYLAEPDEERFEAVLELIDVKAPTVERRKEAPLSQLIWNALPATLESLYVLARRAHRSNRPEAAVRQTIRSLKKRGRVVENERGEICRADG